MVLRRSACYRNHFEKYQKSGVRSKFDWVGVGAEFGNKYYLTLTLTGTAFCYTKRAQGGGENSYRGKVRNSIILKIKYERLTPYYYRKVLLLLKNFHFSPLYKFFEKNFENFFKLKKFKNGLKIIFFWKVKALCYSNVGSICHIYFLKIEKLIFLFYFFFEYPDDKNGPPASPNGPFSPIFFFLC